MILNSKKAIITALLLNVSQVWADITDMQASSDFDGFYVGGAIGLSSFNDRVEYLVNSGSDQLGQLGFVGGLYVGFDYNFSFSSWGWGGGSTQVYQDTKMGAVYTAAPNDFKIGIEGFGNATGGLTGTLNTTTLPVVTCTTNGITTTVNYNAPSNTTLSIDTPYNAGLRILPAYQFQPGIFGHLILGWAYTHFNITDNGRNGIINTSFGKNGIQGGLGWQTLISAPFSWRLDMMYTYYGTQDSGGRGVDGSGSQTFQQKLSTLEAFISLIYKF
jgi:hypothetical protein